MTTTTIETLYDKDGSITALQNKTVAILGYGSQGHAHAQNLRDSGVQVIVANRRDSDNGKLAVEHGFDETFFSVKVNTMTRSNIATWHQIVFQLQHREVSENPSPLPTHDIAAQKMSSTGRERDLLRDDVFGHSNRLACSHCPASLAVAMPQRQDHRIQPASAAARRVDNAS